MEIKSYFSQFPQGNLVDRPLHTNQQNVYDLDVDIVHRNGYETQRMTPNPETMTYCGHCSEHCSN